MRGVANVSKTVTVATLCYKWLLIISALQIGVCPSSAGNSSYPKESCETGKNLPKKIVGKGKKGRQRQEKAMQTKQFYAVA